MRTIRSAAPAVPLLLVLLAGCGGRDDTATDAAAPATGADRQAAPASSASIPPPAAPAVPGAAVGASADVRPLAGQSEAAIRTLLGTPSGCEDVPRGRRCTYPRGQSEIVYIDGIADHIVLGDLGGAPFEPATIARIGLPVEEPLEVTPQAIRWQNVGGMREIVLERGPDGRAARFVIKTMTL